MKAIVCSSWGEPASTLQVRDLPDPVCGPGQVRVRMLASPINPSDLFMVRGQYGYQPPLPCVPGFEGVGIVEEGRGLLAWRVKGRRVAVLNGHSGTWAEQVVIPARQAVPVPEELSDEQAAMFFVNPASAIVLTQHVLPLKQGDWLLQTAAASALGRMIIRLGLKHGFRTINVVRRPEHKEELLRLGATAVIDSSCQDLVDEVHRITGGTGVPYAIDAVGGTTGAACVRALQPNGRLVVYSSLSGEPIAIDPRWLMTQNRRIEGFWLSVWVQRQNPLRMLGLFRRIAALLREGIATAEVGSNFPLERVADAIRAAETPGRQGKVLLRLGSR
ncbi:MAG: zinc-dependent alcohol dehydrogenase family protein [Gemmataceae bacterium]